jgi:hypothetical protein
MKKILDTVTLSGHVFAMLEKWVSDLGDEELFVTLTKVRVG